MHGPGMTRRNAALRALVVAAACVMTLLGTRAAAAGSVTVAAEDVAVAPAGAVALTISGHAEVAVGAFGIEVAFDDSLLAPYSCQTPIAICNTNAAPGLVRLNAVSVAGFSGDLTFATIVFEALGPAGAVSAADVSVTSLSDTSGISLLGDVGVNDGSVTIDAAAAATPPGDANCDSTLTVGDSLAVIGDLAGAYDAGCLGIADVTCDGRVNTADALAILRALGGLPLDLPPACEAIT